MIQRKQSLFLLIAFVAYVLSLFLPIASFSPAGLGADSFIYNLGLVDSEGHLQLLSTFIPLFLLEAVSAIITLVTIFMYKNRTTQINLCSVAMLFTLLWYVDYALLFFHVIPVGNVDGTLEVKFSACLPFVALILVAMAKRGVQDDEKLLKAADRIR